MSAAREIRITGLVQGVFFRAWTAEEARTLGLRGWVRNCSDESVLVYVEGDEDAIDELIELLREGPPDATVENVEVDITDPEGLSSFEIVH